MQRGAGTVTRVRTRQFLPTCIKPRITFKNGEWRALGRLPSTVDHRLRWRVETANKCAKGWCRELNKA